MRAMADGVTVERWERLLTLVDILEPLPQEEIKRLAAGRSFIPLGPERPSPSRKTGKASSCW